MLQSSNVPLKPFVTPLRQYWRPKSLMGSLILDRIDAELYQLQVAYQNMQAERARSCDL